MNVAQKPEQLLDLLKEHENGLAELYKSYSEIFLEYKDFWQELAIEETRHAQWLDNLKTKIESGAGCFIIERFPINAIKTSLNFVNQCIGKAYEPDFQHINALSTALHLEEALIEKKYFEVLQGDGSDVKDTFDKLSADTQQHFLKIKQLWEQTGPMS